MYQAEKFEEVQAKQKDEMDHQDQNEVRVLNFVAAKSDIVGFYHIRMFLFILKMKLLIFTIFFNTSIFTDSY